MNRFDVSIILPTRCEADNLLSLLPEIQQQVHSANLSTEVIVVDDQSSDGTPEVVKRFAAVDSERCRFRLIQRTNETGLSSAAMLGMNSAVGRIVMLMDADHSHPVDMIPQLVAAAEAHDVAVGSRYVSGGKLAKDWPWKRRLLSKFATWLVRPLTSVKDPMAGFFALRQSMFQSIQNQIRPTGFKLLLEVLSQPAVVRTAELPIHFHQRKSGNSKLDGRTQWLFAQQVFRLYGVWLTRLFSRSHQDEPSPLPSRSNESTSAERTITPVRSGFTIVELLIVIAIIGLLISLLLPAVQAAREAARRTTCSNQIRNVALAVIQFHDAKGHYPRSRFKVPDDVGPDSKAWSWIAQVLPFLEEQALYDEAGVGVRSLQNNPAVAKTIPILICPSDARTESTSRLGSGHFEDQFMGVTNYKANMGANWGADETLPIKYIGTVWPNPSIFGDYDGQSRGDGVMWRDDQKFRMKAAKIRDGLSKTFLVGEDLPELNTWNSWSYGNHSFGTCAIPPNFRPGSASWWPDSQSFRSDHAGLVGFAYADGSVQFISDDIDIRAYRDKATRRNK